MFHKDSSFEPSSTNKLRLLSPLINDITKKFFFIKNNYEEEIQELQESLGISVNFIDLINAQHSLIKDLDEISKELASELSFRKLIIERKEHVLKDLNAKIINNFIDKVYKMESTIEELKKENKLLNRINSNIIPKEFDTNNIKRVKYIDPPINVIAPKNNNEFSGTIAFFNNPVKNIQKFINIKNVNVTNTSNHLKQKSSSMKSLNKHKSTFSTSFKSRRTNSQSAINRNENSSYDTKVYNKTMCTLSPNMSWIDSPSLLLNTTSPIGKKIVKPKPTRVTKQLLGKSYEVVKRYQQKV